MTPEEEIEQIKMELLLFGFAAAKRISQLLNTPDGRMDCPLCGQPLLYSTSRSNGHFRASCSREGCLKAME